MTLPLKSISSGFFSTHKASTAVSLAFMVLASILILSSCSGTKAYFKKGVKLEQQGMVNEAAAMYYASLQRNRTNVESKIGLKSAGQQVLNQKLEVFIKAKNLEQKKEAVYSFISAKEYQEKIKRIGVTLEIPPMYETDYTSVTQSYLSDLYNEGTELLEQGLFNEAEVRFKEIGKFDSAYKDAGNLEDIAFLEPKYQSALSHLEAGKFRSAYEDFDDVISRDPNFKEAKTLKEEALNSGLITLALTSFENSTGIRGLDAKVNAYTLDALTKVSDPFLKVVDRENFELILSEQQLGMSGVIDEETAANAGNLIGAKAMLSGTILSYDKQEGRLQKRSEQGYESFRVKKLNRETNKYFYETKYRATTFYSYRQENKVIVSFQYKITSLETGEVLDSRIIEDEMIDIVSYADYGGDNSKLFPSRNNGVNTSRNAKRELDNLLSANRNIRSSAELTNDVMEDLSRKLSSSVQDLIKSQVK